MRKEIMKILVATDAWHPQVNGVVRTLGHVAREARALGAELEFLTPGEFWTLPMPTYPEVRLALPGPGDVERRLERAAAGRHPYCDGRAARPCRAPRLPAARRAVHHQSAHPLSRLSGGTLAGTGALDLRRDLGILATVSLRRRGGAGGDADARQLSSPSAASRTSSCGRAASMPGCSARA